LPAMRCERASRGYSGRGAKTARALAEEIDIVPRVPATCCALIGTTCCFGGGGGRGVASSTRSPAICADDPEVVCCFGFWWVLGLGKGLGGGSAFPFRFCREASSFRLAFIFFSFSAFLFCFLKIFFCFFVAFFSVPAFFFFVPATADSQALSSVS